MTRRRLAAAGVIAVLGLQTSACASDPAFWEGLAIGLDTAALAIALSDPCYGAYTCVYVSDRNPDHRHRDRHRYRGHDRHGPGHPDRPRHR